MKDEQILEKIKANADRIADFVGINVVGVEYVMESGRRVLRIFIGKEGGVGTSDCEAVSRALSKKLDEIDMIKEHYFLEVSSPGIDGSLS